MKWTQIEAGSVYAAGHQLLTALGEDADGVVARINSDSAFVERLAKFAICGGFEPSTSQKRAREIMGKNMFGVEEAAKYFGLNPTRQQQVALSEIPFSEDTLSQCKDTHVLVAVLPISILEIRDKVKGKGLFYSQNWYDNQAFAKERGEVSWQFVCKTEALESLSKNWQEQQKLVTNDDEVPTAQIMVYTIIGHFLATGERLFEKLYVRTSSVDSGGGRVYVGYFGAGGLRLYDYYWDDDRGDGLGLALARKFN